jgi:hypothetical protein
MNIKDLINETNITISVGLNDLKEFANDLIQQTKREMEDLVVAEKSETYISRQQASEMLDVSPCTLWRWAKQDYLVPVSIGGKKKYRMSDINSRLSNR